MRWRQKLAQFFPLALWDPSSVVAASHAAFRRPFPLFRSRALECRLRPLFCSISCRLPLPIFPIPAAAPSLVKARDMPHGAVHFFVASSGGMRCRPYNYAGGMRCRPYNCTTTLDSRSGISEHIQG